MRVELNSTLATLTLVAFLAGAAQSAAADCDKDMSDKDPFYPGKSASTTYDERFQKSHRLQQLETHVPQGVATWSNWDGEDDLLLVTAHAEGDGRANIVALDARSGDLVGVIWIAPSHVGGIAVFEKQGWAFVSAARAGWVRKYSLATLKKALETQARATSARGSPPRRAQRADVAPDPVEAEGPEQQVIGSSFLSSHGPTDTLWAGTFELSDDGGKMRPYKVAQDGQLSPQEGLWQVPKKTQGVVVTKDLIIYSTSHDRNFRSNIYVVRRGQGEADLDKARLHCFRAPSMAEGAAVYGENFYLAYESGADFFAEDENKPRNIIRHLHRVPLAELAALPPR